MKKQLLKEGLVSALGVLTVTSCSSPKKEVKHAMPNIIILYADDMGYGDMSCENPNSKIKTQNLDKLASEGMRFTDGHSSCAVSTPSRFAILTGMYHWRRTYKVCQSFDGPIFKDGDLSIANVLKDKGYYTTAIGKWHLGWDWGPLLKPGAELIKSKSGWGKYYTNDMIDWTKPVKGGPCSIGFDYYYGSDSPFQPPYVFIENEKVIKAPTKIFIHGKFKAKEGDCEMRDGPMVADWDPYELVPKLTNKAIDIIRNYDKSKPLFMYYALPCPHSPIVPNDEYDGKSEAGAYGDYVVETDDVVGKVLKAVKEAGMEDNTIIVFTSDNGPEVYACPRMAKYGHNSSTFRGIKRDDYEGGHRVPFIIKWPSKIKAGSISHEVISQVDLLATFASIVGYELPNDKAVDSYNILPILEGKDYKKPFREATIFNTSPTTFAIRQGNWLYINNYTGSHNGRMKKWPDYFKYFEFTTYNKQDNPGLLFNLKDDIMEKKNVYKENPDVVKEMNNLIQKYRKSGRSIPKR